MSSLSAIIKEMRDVPMSAEEVYQFVHSLNPKFKSTPALKKKILSFAGAFSGMDKKDYADFVKQTEEPGVNFSAGILIYETMFAGYGYSFRIFERPS